MILDIVNQYRQILQQADDWFDQCLHVQGQQMACRSGCSGCCRGLFDITLLDAYLLQQGFNTLIAEQQNGVLALVDKRVHQLQQQWPDFQAPYILNQLPHQQWQEMPEDDLTPCPLLDDDGLCMVYQYRPLTCRLHGIPHIDIDGELFSDSYCSLNFTDVDPLTINELRSSFRQLFQREVELLSQFSLQLTGRSQTELDTFIPTALLIDFSSDLQVC
ncbi:MAG: YkgJ family cysteine cluster protein [Thermodesulfobacteriota bacterium]|nr:YkgJ family cysteine cluster protein [Thermodesulfobacteriota bacterium]